MEKLTPVECHLKDCTYYVPPEKKGELPLCRHRDISLSHDLKRCPLYRLDWEKKYQEFLAAR